MWVFNSVLKMVPVWSNGLANAGLNKVSHFVGKGVGLLDFIELLIGYFTT